VQQVSCRSIGTGARADSVANMVLGRGSRQQMLVGCVVVCHRYPPARQVTGDVHHHGRRCSHDALCRTEPSPLCHATAASGQSAKRVASGERQVCLA
jgi:hypothetical protein